uniref:NHR domain-containing protein n=1 Tax=Neolamprologus brichardi TaxID=32507 RepID=A0A3Q4I426_NEOBR
MRSYISYTSITTLAVSHRCSLLCLGRLNFHRQAVGEKVRLSHGGRLAEKTENTFKNGLVFSSRPVRVQERIRLRVQRDSTNWHGALRVGFTTMPPSARSLPLPCLAIPNLTNKPGHWAVPVNESYCQAGSVLEFWVSHGGSIYIAVNNRQHKLLTGVDLSQPLWAMIDIYGKTRSILLLGSKKTKLLCTRRSCPAPEPLISPDAYSHFGSVPDKLEKKGNYSRQQRVTALFCCALGHITVRRVREIYYHLKTLCRNNEYKYHCLVRTYNSVGVCWF